MDDTYVATEKGLAALLELLGREDPRYAEVEVLRDRLRENTRQERLYGAAEGLRSERAQIIHALNQLATDAAGRTFNEIASVSEPDRTSHINLIEGWLAQPRIRVVNLYGEAGTGKTYLARELGKRLKSKGVFSGGIVFIDCRQVRVLADILQLIGDQFGISGLPVNRSEVLERLHKRPTLLIFDSFDDSSSDEEILSFIGRMPSPSKALVISRQRVRISPREEVATRLGGLSLEETAALLRDTMRRGAQREFSSQEVGRIHSATGGLPIAVRLIGEAVSSAGLSLDAILQGMGGAGAVGPVSIEALLKSAVDILKPREQEVLRALSIFAHSASLEALSIVAHTSGLDLRDSLARLLQMSLAQEAEGGRYILHPVVHAFVRQGLSAQAQHEYEQRLIAYVRGFVGSSSADLQEVDREWPNLQRAMELAFEAEDWSTVQYLVMSILSYLRQSEDADRRVTWIERARLASERVGDIASSAALLGVVAFEQWRLGQRSEAIQSVEEQVKLLEQIDNKHDEALALVNLGTMHQQLGLRDAAVRDYQQAHEISASVGDVRLEEMALAALGAAFLGMGWLERAAECYNRALVLANQVGDRREAGRILSELGVTHRLGREYQQAEARLREALSIFRELQSRAQEGDVLSELGIVLADSGQLTEAEQLLQQAVLISREQGNSAREVECLNRLGWVLRQMQDWAKAERVYREAMAGAQRLGDANAVADALRNLSRLYSSQDRFAEARQNAEQELAIRQRLGVKSDLCDALVLLGQICSDLGDLETAINYLQRAAAISQEIADPRRTALALESLNRVYSTRGERDAALAVLERAVGLAEEAHAADLASVLISRLAEEYANVKDYSQAAQLYERALRGDRILGDRRGEVSDLAGAASVYEELGQLDQAEHYYEQALQMLEQEGHQSEGLTLAMRLCRLRAKTGKWSDIQSLVQDILRVVDSIRPTLDLLNAVLPWYLDITDAAVRADDIQSAVRMLNDLSNRLDLLGVKIPDEVASRVSNLRQQMGADVFAIAWAEAQGTLSSSIALTLQETNALMSQGRFPDARSRLTAALTMTGPANKESTSRVVAVLMSMRGTCWRQEEHWDEAYADQMEALRLFHSIKDYVGMAWASLELGHLLELMNNYEDSRLRYIDAYRLYKRSKNPRGIAEASERLGRLEFRVRLLPQAIESLTTARNLWSQMGERERAQTIDSDLEDARTLLISTASKLSTGDKTK